MLRGLQQTCICSERLVLGSEGGVLADVSATSSKASASSPCGLLGSCFRVRASSTCKLTLHEPSACFSGRSRVALFSKLSAPLLTHRHWSSQAISGPLQTRQLRYLYILYSVQTCKQGSLPPAPPHPRRFFRRFLVGFPRRKESWRSAEVPLPPRLPQPHAS